MDKSTERIPYITLLQAFAIILVVLGHATRIYFYPGGWYYHAPNIHSEIFNVITRIIYTFHMPLFIFISGYLCEKSLLNESKMFDYIKRRFKRLIIPFWIWGLFYSVPIWMFLQFPNCNYKTFINGQIMGHLWFLPLLFEITLIYLFLRLLPKRFNLIIFAGLVALQFLHFGRHDSFSIYRIPEFLAYYYMGAKFFEIEKNKIFSNQAFLNLLTIVTLVLFVLVEYLLYENSFRGILRYILAGISGVMTFVLLSKAFVQWFKKISDNKVIQFLSLNLLSIYLIHEPVLEIVLKYLDWGNAYSPEIITAILFCGTLILTFVMIILLKQGRLLVKNIKKRIIC